MSDETQDVTDTTLDVVEESSQEEARTYSAAEVAKLKREAARLRRERNQHAEQLNQLGKAQEAEAEKRAKEQGEFESLWKKTTGEYDSFRRRAERKVIRQSLINAAIAKGVPAAQARALAYPTDGLKVNDDFDIEGDVDAVLDPFVAPFISSKEPEPAAQPRQPIAITERAQQQKTEQAKGAAATARALAEAIKGGVPGIR